MTWASDPLVRLKSISLALLRCYDLNSSRNGYLRLENIDRSVFASGVKIVPLESGSNPAV